MTGSYSYATQQVVYVEARVIAAVPMLKCALNLVIPPLGVSQLRSFLTCHVYFISWLGVSQEI